MNVRNEMLVALVKEVLGPREGPCECLPSDHDPFSEYITGVLQPPTESLAGLRLEDRIEDSVDMVIEESSSEEDQHSEGFAVLPGIFSPALDPRSLAHSIGLSFTVEAPEGQTPEIEICATWARYRDEEGWCRHPYHFLSSKIAITADRRNWHPEPDPHVELFLRTRRLPGDAWRVSVFLVNRTPVDDPKKRPPTSSYVFQPQIRVNLGAQTKLVPVEIVREVAGEDFDNPEVRENRNLSMLYREHRAMARGHMCGAIWKDIDPERPFIDEAQRPQSAPFIWTDAEIVPESARSRFAAPDVRTELTPIYPIQAPEMGWNDRYGSEPELRPAELAELWEPEALRQALQPLVDGYRKWIEEQEGRITELDNRFQSVARANLDQCHLAANRMQEAIDLLASDRQARLAFCFANKAIDTQAQWRNQQQGKTGADFKWRPFQLAFILLNLPALIQPHHGDRKFCDLLWFPTGGGKTEAYLGLTAFTLALRRRRAIVRGGDEHDVTGGGVSVISRYTLRLLTIQQFRRALGVITACEYLRVQGLKEGQPAGWRPKGYSSRERFLWGKTRFSAGLWVGGGVTPNRLQSFGPIPPASGGKYLYFAGALDILKGLHSGYQGHDNRLVRIARDNQIIGEGEPAQVTHCPACGSVLAVPSEGLREGDITLHFLYSGGRSAIIPSVIPAPTDTSQVLDASISLHARGYKTLSITLRIPAQKRISAARLDTWWQDDVAPLLIDGRNEARLAAVRASRPGYFILSYPQQNGREKEADFEIYCPNPSCELNQHVWAEVVPLRRNARGGRRRQVRQAALGLQENREPGLVATFDEDWQDIPEPFREENFQHRARAIPIPAFTVDDQVYRRAPSLVIATVDKFARLAFEEKAASLFGNVTHYHSRFGYYREGCPPEINRNKKEFQPHPPMSGLSREVRPFTPPDLILQDELHLIEGPLGSMVGLYETAIDLLSQRRDGEETIIPKYIASTATVRKADAQVQSLFARRLFQFPPSALTADDRFFATDDIVHPLDTDRPGRLYVGICAPGKGAQTPIVRIWASLLQRAQELRGQVSDQELDPFWTLVGYFNAVRELAGALSLYRQDIPQWLRHRAGNDTRELDEYSRLELSSRASSTDLPAMLKRVGDPLPSALDAVFATSMFGTGVDVSRLSLMVVHGQPKTTASYIQSTGRVGRHTNGLVVTFFRATRPRDLDHYEFFTGYHGALYRYVEPVTVAPFSPRARDRGLGPLTVILLRQAREIHGISISEEWRVQQRLSGKYHAHAYIMKDLRHSQEVDVLPDLFENRAADQPDGRRPPPGLTSQETASELDRWHHIAQRHPDPDEFVYYEYAMLQQPQRHVVLGDAQHRNSGFDEAFENAPNSLRDVEETTGFKDRR